MNMKLHQIFDNIVNILPNMYNDYNRTYLQTKLNLKNTFGIGYDYKTSVFYVINPNNLSTETEFSLINAQDNTNTNKDASWIIKVEYVEATSLTSANFTLSTRGMRYIFESEEDVRFYFDNAFKTVDVITGQAKRDVISLLKINSDKRSQIDRINISTPGNSLYFAYLTGSGGVNGGVSNG